MLGNLFQKNRPLYMGLIFIMFFVAFQIFADITALKVTNLFGLDFLFVGAGWFVIPFTFTLRDLIHKTMGHKIANLTVVTAVVLNFIMLLVFWLYLVQPLAVDDFQLEVQAASELIYGTVWRIVLASLAAELIAQLLDGYFYELWKKWFGNRLQWGRVLFSNVFGGAIDIVIFLTVAFAGVFTFDMIKNIWITEIFYIRLGLGILTMPLIYLAPEWNLSDAIAKVMKLKKVDVE